MIRKLLAVSLVGLAIPACALASRSAQVNASQQCASVQGKIGVLSFERAFTSFGSCVSTIARLTNTGDAASLCRAERASAAFTAQHGGKTFARFYGVGRTSANAFAVCVALKMPPATIATPTTEPSAPTPVVSGCGALTGGVGKAQALVSRCAVANAN